MTMDPSELTLFLNPPDFFRDHAYAEVLKVSTSCIFGQSAVIHCIEFRRMLAVYKSPRM